MNGIIFIVWSVGITSLHETIKVEHALKNVTISFHKNIIVLKCLPYS